MVGRSNEVSREICRVQDADDKVVILSSKGRCFVNDPGPAVKYRSPVGNESAIPALLRAAARQKSELS